MIADQVIRRYRMWCTAVFCAGQLDQLSSEVEGILTSLNVHPRNSSNFVRFWMTIFLGLVGSLIFSDSSIASSHPVPERFLETESTRSEVPQRVIFVPDFDTIGGCDGFRELLPHILELHPSIVLLSAEDLYDGRGVKICKQFCDL